MHGERTKRFTDQLRSVVSLAASINNLPVLITNLTGAKLAA